MQYARIPTTDLSVSRIAFGGWTIAGGSRWGAVDDDESIRAVRAAVRGGMNLVDTAEAYGNGHSEEVIGRALQGIRGEAVIATKVHYTNKHYRYSGLIQACEASLKRLRTDCIDLYQLHWPFFEDETHENVAKALGKLKLDGKIRYYGLCNFGVEQLEEFLPHGKPVTNQLPYNLLWRSIEHGIVDKSRTAGMGILAYSPLHSGILSGRYRTGDKMPADRVSSSIFANAERRRLALEAISRLFEAAEQYEVTVREMALGWVLRQPGITAVLTGARTVEQVQQNIGTDLDRVPDEAWSELTATGEGLRREIGAHADMYQDPSRIR